MRCDAMLCYDMPRNAMTCHAMLCYDMLCCSIGSRGTKVKMGVASSGRDRVMVEVDNGRVLVGPLCAVGSVASLEVRRVVQAQAMPVLGW
eukprot:899470-Lingulodinium_polyedra.AAC.1